MASFSVNKYKLILFNIIKQINESKSLMLLIKTI